jgi:putative ABC transport system ATP-binding protein
MILTLDRLSKIYPSSDGIKAVKVLKNLDLKVKSGETVAVLGRSGCGKSTLLSMIAGLDSPSSGDIVLNGESLIGMKERRLSAFRAKNIGFVFQQFHLMPHLTALENISLPLELNRDKKAKSKALKTIESIGLLDRQNHFPHQLSGGECQRVAIARALVIEPAILLADEPTGNLDEKTGDQLARLFFELVDSINMTLLLVTHNQGLADQCSRKLILKNGELLNDLA